MPLPEPDPSPAPGLPPALAARLAAALAAREPALDPARRAALRLFAGFYEGEPSLVVDLYGDTLVLHDYAEPAGSAAALIAGAASFYRAALPGLRAGVVKPRHEQDPERRRGWLLWGTEPAREVREAGLRYRVDLLARRDTGFFLDTRELRAWARATLGGRTVLNAFAYTGSLGVAALAGGAERVLQLDVDRNVLNQAKESYTLNGLAIRRADFQAADFFVATRRLRRAGTTFDAVLLDPPAFATSRTGTVDLAQGLPELVNKVRPLVADGGYLVVVNNALFVSGAAFLAQIDRLAADGYLALEARLDVPGDVTGPPATRHGAPPADPWPFNHPTKIAVLRVTRRAPAAVEPGG